MPQTIAKISIHQAKKNFQTLMGLQPQFLKEVNQCIKTSLDSTDEKITQVKQWIAENPGKQFRPLLAMLSAELFGHWNQQVMHYASSVELIHNASLIHDDILDAASFRRGNPTPHQLWGTNNAVLLGDFLFSMGYRLVLRTDDPDCRDDLPRAAAMMCESELLQAHLRYDEEVNIDKYFQVIDGKTAMLFSISAAAGCRLAGGSAEQKKEMASAGLAIGRAFQIMDDWLDFLHSGKEDNKPRGADIGNGIYTLPIIILLNTVSSDEKKGLVKILKEKQEAGFNTAGIKELCEKYFIEDKVHQTALDCLKHAEESIQRCSPKKSTEDILLFIKSIVVS